VKTDSIRSTELESGDPASASRRALPRREQAATAGAVLALAGLVACYVWLQNQPNGLAFWYERVAVCWLLFAIGAWCLHRTPPRVAMPLLVGGAIALLLVALSQTPLGSDDWTRYAWDGKVQVGGVDPYRWTAVDPHLVRFHDHTLWPRLRACPPPRTYPDGCSIINRPNLPTVYPPVAEAYYAAVHLVSFGNQGPRPLQIAAALIAFAVTLLLIRLLKQVGLDARGAVLWAWCPVAFMEAGNDAHIDVLGVLFVVLSIMALVRRRHVRSGFLIGLATAVKVIPGLLLPAMIRRRPLRVVVTAVVTVGLSYLPHVIAVGTHVVGDMPGYLNDEGYSGSGRYGVLQLLVPAGAAHQVAIVLLLVAAVVTALRADPATPWRGALPLLGVAFVLTAPAFPWYTMLVAVLVAMDGRWEYLSVAPAAYACYIAGPLNWDPLVTQQVGYGLALLVIVAGAITRHLTGRSARRRSAVAVELPHQQAEPPPALAADDEQRTGTTRGAPD
jgi:hypothetical protein